MCGSVVFERRSLAAAPAGISLESNGEPSSASFSLPAPLLPLRLPLALGSPCQHYLLPQLVAFALTMLEIPPTLVVFTFSIAQTFFPFLPPPLQLRFGFVVAFYLPFIHLLLCCACLPHRPSLLLIQKCYILLAACEIFGNYSGRIFFLLAVVLFFAASL